MTSVLRPLFCQVKRSVEKASRNLQHLIFPLKIIQSWGSKGTLFIRIQQYQGLTLPSRVSRELGLGKRVSLSRLAVEHLESTGRPLRLAVDIAIWQFQAQAAKGEYILGAQPTLLTWRCLTASEGGSNPATRTLFYRLVRLLACSITPIFVFDGPSKPAFKRNKRSGLGGGGQTAAAKHLIKLFGLPIHQAPGEAEAECALLQQSGVVDAVLSEDVDTIMFGCTRTLRGWTAEGRGSSTGPTHVTIYETPADKTDAIGGLGRSGLVLVALMSGGDYNPGGVPGCGIKLACEIARAGFGDRLCCLDAEDWVSVAQWRSALRHELQTNEGGFFRTRHKALKIPDTFPDLEVLRHYTHPAVSSREAIDRLAQQINKDASMDLVGLREFVKKTFDWTNYDGAVKLIRVLSPSLLVQSAIRFSQQGHCETDTAAAVAESEPYIKSIDKARSTHWSVDGIAELRASYVPASVVPLDLSLEGKNAASGKQDTALNNEEDMEPWPASQGNLDNGGGVLPRGAFDPLATQQLWLPRHLATLGAPLAVESWEKTQAARAHSKPKPGHKPRQGKKTEGCKKSTTSETNRPTSASLENWLRTSKAAVPAREKTSVHEELSRPSSGHGLYNPQVASQRRMLHSEAKLTTSRSKLPKPPLGAGVAGPRVCDDPRTQHFSQNMSRITGQPNPETDLCPPVPAPAWPLPPSTTVIQGSSGTRNIVRDGRRPKDAILTQPYGDSVRQDETPLSSPKGKLRRAAAAPLRQAKITPFLGRGRRSSVVDPWEATPPDALPSLEAKKPLEPQNITTKLFVTCPMTPGFVRQVEVSEDEACILLTEGGGSRGAGRRAWRQSGVSFIDLTGDP